MSKKKSMHLDLDGAWGAAPLGLATHDALAWGPRLRYIAGKSHVNAFWRDVEHKLADFVFYGSGDFHHLAGALIRRITGPFTLVSFDNHPDWDVKPPYWACGGWAARTLKTGRVDRVSVWGCGNFELTWPSRLFADSKALASGKFEVHAWAERQSASVCRRFNCMTRENWRQRFSRFAKNLGGKPVYVTVDLDCLRAEEATTNWENGIFTAQDVAWAVAQLRDSCKIVGGDVCGAYSIAEYQRLGQRLAGRWDHPKLPAVDPDYARAQNIIALGTIWPALADG